MTGVRTVIRAGACGHADVQHGTVALDLLRRTVTTASGSRRFSPARFTVAAALCVRQGGVVSVPELADVLYGDRADGGPLTADRIVWVHISTVRAVLGAIGLRVVTAWGRGWFVEAMEKAGCRRRVPSGGGGS